MSGVTTVANFTLPSHATGTTLGANNEQGFGRVPLPEIRPDDVLVEVFGGPINPSDVYFFEGTYPVKRNRPTIPGFEGSGRVVAVGSSGKWNGLLGANICFFGGDERSFGSYGDYTVMPGHTVYPIPDHVDLYQASAALVNPLTVEIFIDICEKAKTKCIVHTGAAGSLGKILIEACKQANILLINIVRTDNQVSQLKSLGADHVLNGESKTFLADFLTLSHKLKPRALFDAVGGPLASTLIANMPQNSFVYSYGNLSRQDYTINPSVLLFKNVTLTGIWLSKFAGKPSFVPLAMKAFDKLSQGSLKTVFSKTFLNSQIKEALDFYSKNASQGKVFVRNPSYAGAAPLQKL